MLIEDTVTQDKQQTGEIPAVQKPPTMNSLIVERMDNIEATTADAINLSRYIARINERLDMMLILAAFNLICIMLTLIFFGFLFGKVALP